MKTRIVLLVIAVAAMPSLASADAAAGKTKFESVCADCHEPADFAGRTANELTATLKGIAAGTVKHKGKVKLNDAEIADVVAHLKGGASGAASAGKAAAPAGTAARPPTSAPAAATTGRAPPASTPATGAVGGAATSAVATTTGVAGNPAVKGAGKATFEKNCSKCHEVADFAGQPAADLQERLGAIVGGKVKHKPPLKLSDAERQSVAAYLSAGR